MKTALMDRLADLVSRVQAGDPAAFDAVMERFQDLVYGLAITRVRRPEDAQDICQEVFLEAFQKMAELREPHYLPAWLGRLVVKHADRHHRRPKSPALDPALADALPTTASPGAGAHADDEPQLALLTAALARLPSGQRLVLVLYYLCRRNVAAIAETLDLSEAAVKKRLFDGRKRLEARLTQLLEQAHVPMPSQDAGLSRAIRFFLAVRRGELEAVAALLREDPALVHAHEQWTVERDQACRLPDPSGQTALIRAAQNGDQAMIDLLLAHGARVVDVCSCANGEQALHAAVFAGSLEIVDRLLRSHAEVASLGFRGFTPLHLAAMRERGPIVARLLASGAPVDARDGGGRTPLMWAAMHGSVAVAGALKEAGADLAIADRSGRTARDWAEVRGQREVAALLAGRAALAQEIGHAAPLGGRRFDARGLARDGGARIDDAAQASGPGRASGGAPTWWTGIKAIDLFCPLLAGGRIAVHGGYGVGRLVVMSEISRRLALEHGVAVLWVGWERHHAECADLVAEFAEVGIDGLVATLLHRQADPPAAAAALGATVARACQALRARGRDALLWVLDHPDHRDQIDGLLALATGARVAHGQGRVGVALVHDLVATAPSGPLGADWDARIAFDFDLRAFACYPAIHPVLSAARAPESAVIARARDALARLRAHQGWPTRLDGLAPEEARALKLQWFLSQPFDVTEFFMHMPGERVDAARAEAVAAAILDGAHDALPLERMRYLGAAPPAS